ncbi:MAG TPA: PqqD family protein [Actinomycetota bacterium]|nr:PqqD family protein [Actinomycetota bacterium]
MGYRPAGDHVVAEKIDGEVLIVNLSTGFYYSLLNAAVDVWESAVLGGDRHQVVAGVLERFEGGEESMAGPVDTVLGQLLDENLLVDDPSVALRDARPSNGKRLFKAPVFEKYDDMQDLILLDPVHEVDPEQGWPRAKDDTRDEESSTA